MRRKVVRVSIAYTVASWVLLQFIDVVSPILTLPDWVPRLVLVLLVIGFVPAVILAWAVELTPAGLKVEADAGAFSMGKFVGVRRVVFSLVALLALAVVFFSLKQWFDNKPQEPAYSQAKSIAVLPFVNMSSDPEQEFFSEGITEQIMSSLAAISDLKVAGRTSSFAFKNQNQDLRKIGDLLGVEYLLEGSVRKAGGKVRITAQLIQVNDGFRLWSSSYDRELMDIFAIQDDIASKILSQLKNRFLGKDIEITQSARTDTDVYDLYLRGRYALNRRGIDSLERAMTLFKRAIERDPNYGPAYLDLANAYLLLPSYSNERPEEMYESAIEVVNRGVEKDPSIAITADGVYGYIHNKRGEWLAADSAFQSALGGGKRESTTRQWYSQMLSSVGRLRDALEQARLAERIDPLSPVVVSRVAISSLWSNDNEAAEAQFRVAQELGIEGQLQAESYLLLLIREGRFDDARAIAQDVDPFPDVDPAWFAYLLDCLAKTGHCTEADSALREAQALPPRVRLIAWALLGNIEMVKQVARALETNKDAFETELLFVAELKAFRQDSEFEQLANKLGFTSYWHQAGCKRRESGVVCKERKQP
jgi:TolB-like protein/Tfp pilus assembly protein PilF